MRHSRVIRGVGTAKLRCCSAHLSFGTIILTTIKVIKVLFGVACSAQSRGEWRISKSTRRAHFTKVYTHSLNVSLFEIASQGLFSDRNFSGPLYTGFNTVFDTFICTWSWLYTSEKKPLKFETGREINFWSGCWHFEQFQHDRKILKLQSLFLLRGQYIF